MSELIEEEAPAAVAAATGAEPEIQTTERRSELMYSNTIKGRVSEAAVAEAIVESARTGRPVIPAATVVDADVWGLAELSVGELFVEARRRGVGVGELFASIPRGAFEAVERRRAERDADLLAATPAVYAAMPSWASRVDVLDVRDGRLEFGFEGTFGRFTVSSEGLVETGEVLIGEPTVAIEDVERLTVAELRELLAGGSVVLRMISGGVS